VLLRSNSYIFFLYLSFLSISKADFQEDKSAFLSASLLNKEAYSELKVGNYGEVYRLSKLAIERSEKESNRVEYARALSNLASSFHYLGDNEKAFEFYSQSLAISKSENNLLGINRALNNIAELYSVIGELEEVLKYRELQLENSLLSENKKDQVKAYLGLTVINARLGHLEKAENFKRKAYQLLEQNPDPFLEIYALVAETSIFDYQKNASSAIISIKKALLIAKENDFRGLIVMCQSHLAEYYFSLKNYSKAIKAVNTSLVEAEALGLKSKIGQGHLLLSKIYSQKRDFRQALIHSDKFYQLSKTLSGEKIRQLAEITKIDRQIIETEEKLLQSQKDQQILTLQLAKQEQAQWTWIASIAVFSITIGFFFYRRTSRRELLGQKQVNEQLVELDQVKDRVLTNTSHELRTPLNGIIGLSEVMLQGESDNMTDSMRNSIKLIKSSGEQLALVVNDILDFAQIKSERFTPKLSQFDLTILANEVVSVCQPLADKKGIDLVVDNHLVNIHIQSDRSRLQQILFNVVGNAIKFTTQGQVQIQLDSVRGEVNITVSDTGIGIPKEHLERVFKGFEQVDSGDNRAEQGSGLGLAISLGLVEALGGSLTLHSVLGDGTQVNINLPLTVGSD